MSDIRSEISKKNPNYISKNRFLELKHHCYQYKDWEEELRDLRQQITDCSYHESEIRSIGKHSDRTANIACRIATIENKMDTINKLCEEVDDGLKDYIFMAVTEGTSYIRMQTVYNIPCCKNTFSKYYREFFYRLDKIVG